jgi:hypothetical protein
MKPRVLRDGFKQALDVQQRNVIRHIYREAIYEWLAVFYATAILNQATSGFSQMISHEVIIDRAREALSYRRQMRTRRAGLTL